MKRILTIAFLLAAFLQVSSAQQYHAHKTTAKTHTTYQKTSAKSTKSSSHACTHCRNGYMDCPCDKPYTYWLDGYGNIVESTCNLCSGLGIVMCPYCQPYSGNKNNAPSKPASDTKRALDNILEEHNKKSTESMKTFGRLWNSNASPADAYNAFYPKQ